MGKRTGPRHGSMQFYPRKKTKRIYPSVNSFKETDTPKLMGYPAYKAGMTRVVATETHDKSPAFRQPKAIPVTVLETPEVFIFGIRLYEKTHEGLKATAEILADKIPKNVSRKIKIPKDSKTKQKLEENEKMIEKTAEIRALILTQPDKINLKKTPEILELRIGGSDIKAVWEYAKQILGKEMKASEILSEGAWIDVTGVTRGKGTQGPVKRFGIKIQARKAKGHRRRPGSIGAWHPARVLYTVPQAGQLGFFKRTEYNKMILKIGENGKDVTPKGGFLHYGEVKSSYILIKGSVPGPKKRLIVVREAIRGGKKTPMPSITHISTSSQQG